MIKGELSDSYLGARKQLIEKVFELDNAASKYGSSFRNAIFNKLIEDGIINEDVLKSAELLKVGNVGYDVPNAISAMSIQLDGANIETSSGTAINLQKHDEDKRLRYCIHGKFISYIDKDQNWYLTIASDEIRKELQENGFQSGTVYVPLNDNTKFLNPKLDSKLQELLEIQNFQTGPYQYNEEISHKTANIVDRSVFLSQIKLDINDKVNLDTILSQISSKKFEPLQFSETANTRDDEAIDLNQYSYNKWKDSIASKAETNIKAASEIKKLLPYLTIEELKNNNHIQSMGVPEDYITSTFKAIECAQKAGIDITDDIANINSKLLPLGMSYIQLKWNSNESLGIIPDVLDSEKGPLQQKRIIENSLIEEYLGHNTTDYFEEDISFTNINRIKAIMEKMESTNPGDKRIGKLALQYVTEHLSDDLGRFGEINKEQKELLGINYEDYQKKLDTKLSEIGLSYKDFTEKDPESKKPIDVVKKVSQRFNTRNFIKEYGGVLPEQSGKDIVQQITSQIQTIENMLLQENQRLNYQNFNENQYGENFYIEGITNLLSNLYKELPFYLDEDFKNKITSKGINWETYESELNKKLKNLGVSTQDFLSPLPLKGNDSHDFQSSGLSLEEYIKQSEENLKQTRIQTIAEKIDKFYDSRWEKKEGPYAPETLHLPENPDNSGKAGYEDCIGDESLKTSSLQKATKIIREDSQQSSQIESSNSNKDVEK